jgi:hypothetical protein
MKLRTRIYWSRTQYKIMATLKVELFPERVEEWANEDIFAGTLSRDIEDASIQQAKDMLHNITLTLPPDILKTELVDYNNHLQTPLNLEIPPDNKYNYFLIGVPLNIVLTEKTRMVRLALSLDMKQREVAQQPVAYDLFPNDKIEIKKILSGEFSLDIAKTLNFVTKGSFGEIFSLKLEKPFSWTSQSIKVDCSDKMSNPAKWYVKDESIQNGFTGYVVAMAAKKKPLNIEAALAVELRKAGLISGHLLKATFKSVTKTYHIRAR